MKRQNFASALAANYVSIVDFRFSFPPPVIIIFFMSDEIKLWSTHAEREKWETLADIYSIFMTTEHLEKAYIRDAISAEEYTVACNKLIAQFKTAVEVVGEKRGMDWQLFFNTYQMNCPAALRRLTEIGVPATVEHSAGTETLDKSAKHVAATVRYFITVMDMLKINMLASDQLHPALTDLMLSMNKVPNLGPDFEPKHTIKKWLITLNKMGASGALNSEEARQLLFELDAAYTMFNEALSL